ncbi:transforming growth factor-beta-induced protein ig-h3-like [Ruditapes philippinarum]|uniref:transforming growth factor-beta-induced protein ig-h3-like n=1 Tax=Ruditapes philippinarum TaxID=129788 RepID=UPI00295AE211|nr:transforming growth factor-beta-induced protein ig-h3-like [Ruditapes philippinarum]
MLVNILFICGASLAVVHTFEDKQISQWLAVNSYSTCVSLLKQAGLYDIFNGPGAYTMFAPSNAAFSKVPQSTLNSLVSDKALLVYVLKNDLLPGFAMTTSLRDGRNVTLLAPTNDSFLTVSPSLPDLSLPESLDVYKKILRNHVVNGVFRSNALHSGEVVIALGGRTLHISINSNGVLVTPTGSRTTGNLTEPDVPAINGLIHVVNNVLIPHVCRTSVMSSKKITSFFKRASMTDSGLPVPETPEETLANKLVEDATDRASTSGKRPENKCGE